MPRFLQPKKSTEHRVAAIALYRALLSGCSSAALSDDDRTLLSNAIRNKFRQNRKIQSPYQLGLSFKLGYETVDKLDTTTADDAASVSTLSRLIAALPRGLTAAPPTRRPTPPSPSGRHSLAILPLDRAVLNVRPHAQVSGTRKVPVIASANAVPFLRLTKPQPAALSRVLRQKLARRIGRFHQRIELQNYWIPLAKQEDEWDMLMAVQLRKREDEVNWTDVMFEAERRNGAAYEEELARDREMIKRMQGIVDEETRLALKEGEEVIRGRKKAPIRVLKP
ncbi:DNA repair protein [Stagonosporopsis vannaccii]|nr:DNA repair protein [Stagonosporopsis vannaccii]